MRWASNIAAAFHGMAAGLLASGLASSAAAAPPGWVSMAPRGGEWVRAFASNATCPFLLVDGHSHRMNVRAASTVMPSRPSASGSAETHPSAFPSAVCEARLPRAARSASVAGQRLPLPPPIIRRIVLIGDTGCRLKASDQAWQACNDPAGWRFPAIARAAAATDPDLIIHVGDYLYRETACPAGNAGCAGSPWGYGEDSWRADWFDPATPLLAAAPVVFARGNHESCDRAGQGWHRLLAPNPLRSGADCQEAASDFAGDHAEPYAVDLGGGAQLILLDLASIGSKPLDDNDPRRARFTSDAGRVRALEGRGKTSFLVGHYPFAAVRTTKKDKSDIGNPAINATFGQKDLMPSLPGIAAILSGHVHQFEQVSFAGKLPSQIVTGFSGTLEDDPPAPIDAREVKGLGDGVTVSSLLSIFGQQGFGLLERRSRSRWTLGIFDDRGIALARCELVGRQSQCTRLAAQTDMHASQ